MHRRMWAIRLLLLFVVVLVSAEAAAAERHRVSCGAFHFIRSGLEVGTTAISFRNLDPQNAATIERLTIRGFSGTVLHDSGPVVGVPHPINTDVPGGQDVTVVPPGASYYVGTNHLSGTGFVQGDPSIDHDGFSMSVTVEYSKAGNPDLLVVGRSLRVRRQSFPGGPQGNELSRDSGACLTLDR
ncbi:MAG TPA: hypothetical protein VNN07_18980 [Candidatus Tectomicrobia bacterium]|nr:hypothetical protein [Candidatus Tectomicrobia bacterium]